MHFKKMGAFSAFSEAARTAKDVARLFNQTTGVQPLQDGGWMVLAQEVPDRGLLVGRLMDEAEAAKASEWPEDPIEPSDGYTSAEMSSDQDDWHRADQDGWFYED